MIWIIIMLLLFGSLALISRGVYLLRSDHRDDATLSLMILWIACIFAIPATCYFLCRASTGFWPDYSVGTREGFVTKISRKGAFWKTNEAQIQVGTGDMAALQAPFEFSIPDTGVLIEAENLLGKRVRVTYTQWVIQPWSRGETDYEVTKIEEVK